MLEKEMVLKTYSRKIKDKFFPKTMRLIDFHNIRKFVHIPASYS